jgi:hypothetical protein
MHRWKTCLSLAIAVANADQKKAADELMIGPMGMMGMGMM